MLTKYKCITSGWVLVECQGGIISREGFFKIPEQGILSHTTMAKEIIRVKVYGDIILVTQRG